MSLSHRSWRTVSGLIGRPRSFPRGCEKLRQSLLLPLSCGSSLTDCVRLKSPIFPSFIKQNCILAATVQRAGTLTYFPPSIRFSIPTLGLFSPLCFQRRWLLQTAMSVCVRVCVHSRYKKKKRRLACALHTLEMYTLRSTSGETLVYLFLQSCQCCYVSARIVIQFGVGCRSVIHTYMLAQSRTQTHCNCVKPNCKRKILGEKTDSRQKTTKTTKKKNATHLNSFYNDVQHAQTIFAHRSLNWEKKMS